MRSKDKVLSQAKSFKDLKEKRKQNPNEKVRVVSLISMAVAAVLSLPEVLCLYVADIMAFVLRKFKVICFSKYLVHILITLLLSSLVIMNGVIYLMGMSADIFPGFINEKNAENILVFASLIIIYALTRFVLKFIIKHFDSKYKKCSGELSKKNYIETIYSETKLVYTLMLVFFNIFFKVFVLFPEQEKFINAFFISSTIITLFNPCVATWKNIDESKYTNDVA